MGANARLEDKTFVCLFQEIQTSSSRVDFCSAVGSLYTSEGRKRMMSKCANKGKAIKLLSVSDSSSVWYLLEYGLLYFIGRLE